jgi:hypothetical protein
MKSTVYEAPLAQWQWFETLDWILKHADDVNYITYYYGPLPQ